MKKSKNKMLRGLTLVELIVSLIIISILLVVLGRFYVLIYSQVAEDMKTNNLHLQLDYALENVRLHCTSAIRLDPGSIFQSRVTSNKQQFGFEGETNIFRVTPDNLTDNAGYRYFVNATSGALVILTNGTAEEVLVDGQFQPEIEFTYTEDNEPNFLTVTVTAKNKKELFSKTEGVRFWFVDVVK